MIPAGALGRVAGWWVFLGLLGAFILGAVLVGVLFFGMQLTDRETGKIMPVGEAALYLAIMEVGFLFFTLLGALVLWGKKGSSPRRSN